MFASLTSLDSSLFNDFRRMEQLLDSLFGGQEPRPGLRSPLRGAYPPIDVGATEDKVDVYLFAAGLDTASLDVSIQQNLLTIAGERKVEEPEGGKFYRKERFRGEFRRVVTLPEDVDPEQVEACYADGILQVSVKRREASKPRQIEIK